MATSLVNKQLESERRKKALAYTLGICAFLLLMFFLISWKTLPPPPPPFEQLIEVNLGNFDEGMGEEQPLIKGEGGPAENISDATPTATAPEEDAVIPDDNAEKDAAPVNNPVKNPTKVVIKAPVVTAISKPAKPRITMPGQTNKNTGNNPDEDNSYTMQGNKKGGTGDAGVPNGDKDSYGNTPGGATGGRKIIRNINTVRNYSFTGDLPKATIYAIVKISASGRGTFMGFDKGSTTRDSRYAADIKTKLLNIQFQKPDYESTVTVQFNFKEN